MSFHRPNRPCARSGGKGAKELGRVDRVIAAAPLLRARRCVLTAILGNSKAAMRGAGHDDIYSPPNKASLVLNSGDTLNVDAGGTAVSTTINSGGVENVRDGGASYGTTINSGGRDDVYTGGSDFFTTINNGGRENVQVGGTATSTTINDGGRENVYGAADST